MFITAVCWILLKMLAFFWLFKKTNKQILHCIHYQHQHVVNIVLQGLGNKFFIFTLHSVEECENMSRYDRQDRNARQHQEEFWKRAPQQRWNTQDHYHLGHTEHYIHGKNDLNR